MKRKEEWLITISTHNGSQAHRGHNVRDERAIKNQTHIDREKGIEIWKDEKPRDAYRRLFGQAVKDYNEKQTRADRRIDDYYNKIHESKKQHPVYEMIVQVGSKDNPVSDATSKEILREYYSTWDERNPNLELIGAYLHPDEKGSIHLHCDYVPVAEYEKGLAVRAGLNRAFEAQGFEKAGKSTPQMQWEKSENAYLERLCRDRGLEVEHPERNKSPEQKRAHEETLIYQANKDLDKREKEVADKEREQARKGRALDKQEKELSEARQTLNKDVKTVATERDRVEAVKAKFEANRDVIEQVRDTANKIKSIRADTFEMPAPEGKTLHKGYYTAEQVRELTKEINYWREMARDAERGREVSNLDERMERASKQANQNIREKALDRLQDENRELQKDRDFVDWLERNYDMKDIKKEYEKDKEKEHTREREHTHDRSTPSR